MADYMYLMAKLPYLGVFPPPFPLQIVLEDYKEFEKTEKRSKTRIKYEEFLGELEDEIFRVRNGENFILKILNEHIAALKPYEREMTILGIKWKFLEELSSAEPNDDWLWIYREKVEIINRFQLFEVSGGVGKYRKLVQEVRENASQ